VLSSTIAENDKDPELEPPEPNPIFGEQDIINTLLNAQLPLRGNVRIGPGDDAAVLSCEEAITVDTLIESVHFDDRLSPADVGFKAVAVSASDLGSMGARPTWMLLALSTPSPVDVSWITACSKGLADACRHFNVTLIGGDTTRSPGPRFLSVTMGGKCIAEPMTRSGASPDEEIWVTGMLGSAGLGLQEPTAPTDCQRALKRPRPPIALALELARRRLPTACLDLSDGLAIDLKRLCQASGVGALVFPDRLPGVEAVLQHPQALQLQVAAGEDYQFLFSAPKAVHDEVLACAANLSERITSIGVLTKTDTVLLHDTAWPAPLFSHFARGTI